MFDLVCFVEVLRQHGASLTEFEKKEIFQFKKIYYFGKGAEKQKPNPTESYNDGFDNKGGDYRAVRTF